MNSKTKQTKPPRPAEKKPAKSAARTLTKKAQLIALLRQKGGQDIDTLGRALGWQAHTVRAALTGLKKNGYTVTRTEGGDGAGRYAITGSAA